MEGLEGQEQRDVGLLLEDILCISPAAPRCTLKVPQGQGGTGR